MKERLQKILSARGVASRRKAEEWILAGRVQVDGRVAGLGDQADPALQTIAVDGRPLPASGEPVYIMLNKPRGVVTTLRDQKGRPDAAALVAGCGCRVWPVGRLDMDSEGLLLFTNDGDMTRQLTHPSYRKKKIYQVSLDKPLTRADMDRIAEGITLEDGEIHADEIAYVKEDKSEIGIEIHSGRNRIVRRIFESLGYSVSTTPALRRRISNAAHGAS